MAPKSSPLDRISQSFTAVKEVRRRKSANLPERFSNDEDDQEDVTAPHGKAACMNQSIFSMITAAGSRTNFNARFDDDGSSSDESVNRSPKKVLAALSAPVDDAAGEVHQGAVDPVPEDHLTSAYNLPRTPPAQRRPTKVPEDKRVQKDEATHTSKSPVPLKKVEERPRARKLSDAQVESSVGISVDPEEQIARESLLQGAKDIPDLASHLRDIFGLTSTEQIIRGTTLC